MTESIKYALALKALREARGLGARELSVLAGLPDYTVSRIETGKLGLDFITAYKLTQPLGVTLDTLASTANALPAELVAQELALVEARNGVHKLRQKTKQLRSQVASN